MNYQIIVNEVILDDFLSLLPDTLEHEVYYLCLFARHKYCDELPNSKDISQLARFTARKEEIKEKIRRLESPIGSYSRDGVIAPQSSVALYIGINPRSFIRANKGLLVEMAKRVADGKLQFNPLSVATTEIHKATDRKFYVDFDYDVSFDEYAEKINAIMPKECYKVLLTRGGFHVLVNLEKIKGVKVNWYQALAAIPGCDVKGTNNLTPVPGCTQGGFTPRFV